MTSRTLINALVFLPRAHKQRPWMTDSYHARVQKKWTKRGLTEKNGVLRTVSVPSEVLQHLQHLARMSRRSSHEDRQ